MARSARSRLLLLAACGGSSPVLHGVTIQNLNPDGEIAPRLKWNGEP